MEQKHIFTSRWSHVDYLFWFLTLWTVVQFTMCVVEFIHLDTFSVPGEMPAAYFLLIIIYVLRKEVDRWLRKHWKKRKGEFFLIGWWCGLLIMFIIEFKTHGHYAVPKRMIETCIWILIPFAATAVSKIVHARVKSDAQTVTEAISKTAKKALAKNV